MPYDGTMRADRLLSILMILQVQGHSSVRALASQLEVSERTIRRDLEALCICGVPLHSARGRNGGWCLYGEYRLSLSGLNVPEALALFIAVEAGSKLLPSATGIQELQAARRKVLVALPSEFHSQIEDLSTAYLWDQSPWRKPVVSDVAKDATLKSLEEAISAKNQVIMNYKPPDRAAGERCIEPRGLVCKQGVWYLLASSEGGLRTYRVSRIQSVAATDWPVTPMPGFNLQNEWANTIDRMSSTCESHVSVQIAVEPDWLGRVSAMLKAWWPVIEIGHNERGWVELSVDFANVAIAAAELARFTSHVEAISPSAVRQELSYIGQRLVSCYDISNIEEEPVRQCE